MPSRRVLAVVGMGLGLLVAACDPSETDPTFWARTRATLAEAGASDDDLSGEPFTPDEGSSEPSSPGQAPPPSDGGSDVGGGGGTTGATVPAGVKVTATTASYGGKYRPANVGAIWITRADGTFVRTLEVWGVKRRRHLVAWRASSGESEVDIISNATAKSAGAHTATWNLRDKNGAVVAPGSFVVHFEFTEENSSEGKPAGPHRLVPFEAAIGASAPVAPDDAFFKGIGVTLLQ